MSTTLRTYTIRPFYMRKEINEEEFFGFAKRYLSEAFPNPRRVDCPPDSDLIGLAENPKEADPFIP
jgi:hypothetical protein